MQIYLPIARLLAFYVAARQQLYRATQRFLGHGETRVTDAMARHRGVGRTLLSEVCRLARQAGCRRLELSSHRRRDDAHAFYRSQGFDETHLCFHREL